MKKKIQIIFCFILLIIGILIYLYFDIQRELIDLIILNIIIYLLRTILLRILNAVVKNRIIKLLASLIINLVWIGFIFALLFFISPIFALSIITFLIIAIALTFKDLLSNIASGAIILTSRVFEPGDLIETNGVQGIVEEITLNYTKIREFDGILVFIPNSKIFNSSVTKFTHRRLKKKKAIKDDKISKKNKKGKIYINQVKQVIISEHKITSYAKDLEITATVNPVSLTENLNKVFDKYELILGRRPTYNVNHTTSSPLLDRCNITIRINSNNPILILEYTDAFMRDLLFELNKNEIFEGWSDYKKNLKKK